MALMMVVVFPVIWPRLSHSRTSRMRGRSRKPSWTRCVNPCSCLTATSACVSRSYYLTFRVDRQDVLGRPLYALGDGQWHIPALRILLEKIIPERAAMDALEVRS